jgi:acyl-CoA synthetase (AMP-forming)/AMP-acid ligase II
MNYLMECLEKHAKVQPQKIFLVDENRTWSFSSFYEDVAKFSTFLLDKGIKKGDFVVIHLEQKSKHLMTYMALLNIGAISVHLYPERENDYVKFAAEHTQAKAIISNNFKENIKDIIVFDFPKENKLEPTFANNYNEIAYVMFTSGTTSAPKAVLTTHENIEFVTNTLINLSAMRENKEKEIVLLPLGSTGGLGHFHASLVLGNYIRLFPGLYSMLDDNAIDRLLDYMKDEKITGVLLTPGLISRLLHFHKKKFKNCTKELRYALANVTPMKNELIKELLALLPNLRFCTYYGSTEASRSVANVCREDERFMHLTGKEVSGVQIQIEDINNKGEGELLIKGANVMKGYLKEKNSLKDGWFHTGDIARIEENGYISILGRIKDTISIDGLKLFPMEIENAVLIHPDIEEAGICLITEKHESILALAIVVKNNSFVEELIAVELFSILNKYFKVDETFLYQYKIPKKIYFVASIPRTGLGKIDRVGLSKLLNEKSRKDKNVRKPQAVL